MGGSTATPEAPAPGVETAQRMPLPAAIILADIIGISAQKRCNDFYL